MYSTVRERSRRIRRTRWVRAVGAFVSLLAPIVAFSTIRGGGDAAAAPAVAQTYYTPFEAQQFIGILRAIAGDPGCCDSPVISTISTHRALTATPSTTTTSRTDTKSIPSIPSRLRR